MVSGVFRRVTYITLFLFSNQCGEICCFVGECIHSFIYLPVSEHRI